MAINFRPTTEIDLAGHNFVITHWGPMKAMKNMPKIGKIVAVPLGAIGGSILSGGQNMQRSFLQPWLTCSKNLMITLLKSYLKSCSKILP